MDGVDLEIQAGEFFTLLGPSGSGKTTTLRLIAGFERPDEGAVELGGRDVSDVPPYARDVNTVFQDYALFPHMTVAENVGYGLRVKRRAAQRSGRHACDEVLRRMRLPPTSASASRPSSPAASASASRSPARSSTGPSVLLLDEPLGALDLKLRQEMQLELKRIQQELGDHVRLRHARPGRGADDERPHRRLQPGADRADRRAGRGLRAAGERVRRRVRRRLERARAGRQALHRAAGEDPHD